MSGVKGRHRGESLAKIATCRILVERSEIDHLPEALVGGFDRFATSGVIWSPQGQAGRHYNGWVPALLCSQGARRGRRCAAARIAEGNAAETVRSSGLPQRT